LNQADSRLSSENPALHGYKMRPIRANSNVSVGLSPNSAITSG
jgi:hypothetical protein